MKNKVLVKMIIPEIGEEYDMFLPVNELVWKVKMLSVKAISDLTDGVLKLTNEYLLINAQTGYIYKNNEIIINTDIRNSTELFLLTVKKM